MYSPNCNFLPTKKQSPFHCTIPQNFKMLKSCTTQAFSSFEHSSPVLGLGDFNTSVDNLSHNQLTSGTRHIMDFMYSFNNSSRLKLGNNIPKFPVQTESLRHKEMISQYDSVSTMSLASTFIVGGFVGSKSQLGRRPTHGFGIKMWDIIRDLLDLVGRPASSSEESSKKLPEKTTSGEGKVINTGDIDEKQIKKPSSKNNSFADNQQNTMTEIHKQSYADVTKAKVSIKIKKEPDSIEIEHHKENLFNNSFTSNLKPVIEPLSFCNENYHKSRDRIASECSASSEDSFIVFEYCDEDYSSGSESSSDDESVLDFQVSPPSTSSLPSSVLPCLPSELTIKKVRFAETLHVHPMVTWGFAYREARKGPWETLARDTDRFRCRIAKTAVLLEPVLQPQHRQAVYQQRFAHTSE